MFEIVYAVTLVFFGIAFTFNSFSKKQQQKKQKAVHTVINNIERDSGFRLSEKSMSGFFDFIVLCMMFLPVVNTTMLLFGLISGFKKAKARKEQK